MGLQKVQLPQTEDLQGGTRKQEVVFSSYTDISCEEATTSQQE